MILLLWDVVVYWWQIYIHLSKHSSLISFSSSSSSSSFIFIPTHCECISFHTLVLLHAYANHESSWHTPCWSMLQSISTQRLIMLWTLSPSAFTMVSQEPKTWCICLDMLNPPEKTDPTRPSPDSGGLGWLSQNPRVTLGPDWPTCRATG